MNKTNKIIYTGIIASITTIFASLTLFVIYTVNNTEDAISYVSSQESINNNSYKEYVTNQTYYISDYEYSDNSVTETTTKTINNNKPPKKDTKVKTKVEGIGKIKGNVDEYYLSLLNTELNKIPSKVLNRFISEGWNIYVTDENLAETVYKAYPNITGVQGVTKYSDKTILIEAKESSIKESTIHEFGHFVDYITDFKTTGNLFNKIYVTEVEIFKSNISNPGCVSNKQEFFAEAFYYKYTDSSKVTIQVNDFIEMILNEL